MSMQTPTARVRGLGSAKGGTDHWWQQRVSAVAMAVLAPLFLIPFAMKLGKPWEEVASFYKHPLNAIIASLFLIATFYHLRLGLQVVIEDYVHGAAGKVALVAMKLLSIALGFAAVFSVAMVAFSV